MRCFSKFLLCCENSAHFSQSAACIHETPLLVPKYVDNQLGLGMLEQFSYSGACALVTLACDTAT